MDGVSISQETEVEENGLKLRAVQAVRTDNYYYFLLQMTIPEGVWWNEDICFEDVRIPDTDFGCNADFVEDSAEEDTVLLEVQVYPYETDGYQSVSDLSVRRAKECNACGLGASDITGRSMVSGWDNDRRK